MTNSVNTVYAQVGEALGRQMMARYMRRFGFYADPPLDYPDSEMNPSGLYFPTATGLKLVPVSNDHVDLGRMAIGQAQLGVTPLQMAMVSSAVANGGTLMQPRLASKVLNPDGQIVETVAPTVYDHVMTPHTAAELAQMMSDVVEEGTGTGANLEGLQAAGKTGTAQVGGPTSNLDDAWLIGFAPVSHPRIAIAVTLLDIPNGYGGQYAAPIAAQMMKQLIAEGW